MEPRPCKEPPPFIQHTHAPPLASAQARPPMSSIQWGEVWRDLKSQRKAVAISLTMIAVSTVGITVALFLAMRSPKPQFLASSSNEPFLPAPPFLPPDQVEHGSEVISVNLETLWRAYDANEVRANQAYKGKRIELVGTVADIDVTLGSISLTLRGANRWHKVHAAMKDSMAEHVSSLNKGDSVRVRCDVGGKMFSEPMLRECAFAY